MSSNIGRDPQTGEKFHYFWKKESPFSQHYPSKFWIDGVVYNCAEQYMMHQKALLFQDEKTATKILAETNPIRQKALGRSVVNYDDEMWNSVCQDVVYQANLAKFSQNEKLKRYLLDTIGSTLVEASPFDKKWGIGLEAQHVNAHCRKKWRGKNLLGEILMRVRNTYLN